MTVPLWRKREPGLSIPPLKALQGSFIRHFHFSSNIISFNNIMSSTMSVNTFSSADHSTLLSTSCFQLHFQNYHLHFPNSCHFFHAVHLFLVQVLTPCECKLITNSLWWPSLSDCLQNAGILSQGLTHSSMLNCFVGYVFARAARFSALLLTRDEVMRLSKQRKKKN